MWCTDLVAPRRVGSSQTRDRTRVSYLGGWIHHWTTREAPRTTDLKLIIRSPGSLSPSRQLIITELPLKPHWLTWTRAPAVSRGQVCRARPPLPGLCSGLHFSSRGAVGAGAHGVPGFAVGPKAGERARGPDALELTWSGASTSVLGGWEGARLRGPHAWNGPQRRDDSRGTAERMQVPGVHI